MKKSRNIQMIFIVLGLFIILSGCNKKEPIEKEPVKDPVESTEDVGKEDVDKDKVMKEFESVVVSNKTDKIIGFIDEKIGKLSTVEGDKMISDFEKVLENGIELRTNNLFKLDNKGELLQISKELFFPEDRVKDIKDEKLREEVTSLFNSKYKLINLEGSYYPIIDYEKLKKYDKNISPELKDYIGIKALDSNVPVAIDAALYITHDDLAHRIIKTEEFLKKYSGGQRYEEMLKAYRNKLSIYMAGMDNAPIADRETKKINDDVMNSYKKTAGLKDTVTSSIITKYIKVIEENEYIINNLVKENTLSLINESISLLEANK